MPHRDETRDEVDDFWDKKAEAIRRNRNMSEMEKDWGEEIVYDDAGDY